jgi:hypothetical protein
MAAAARAHLALSKALLAARSAAAAAQEQAHSAALLWERERHAADVLARQVAEVEYYLSVSTQPPPYLDYIDAGASSSHQVPSSSTVSQPDPADPMVIQLHLQAAGVQNIRALVPVVLDPMSSSYRHWRDLSLLTLRRYALDDHVLLDMAVEERTPAWQRLDSVAQSWLLGTLSLEL